MRYSVLVYGRPIDDFLELSIEADRLGFHGVWLSEHLVHPGATKSTHPPGGAGESALPPSPGIANAVLLDPFVALAAAAQATRQLQVGTGMALLAIRHPLFSAREAITLSQLSGGRFSLGVASGWLREDFAAIGIEFANRVARLEESVEIIRAASAGGTFSYSGRYYSFDAVSITNDAIAIPIIFGGNAPVALRRAARMGDGWFISGSRWTPDDVFAMRDEIEAHRQSLGRSDPFRIYARYEFTGEADLERYQSEGIEDLQLRADHVWPPGESSEAKCARLEEVAHELGVEPRR